MASLDRLLEVGRQLDQSLAEWLADFDRERQRWKQEARRIEQLAVTVCASLGLEGSLQAFGSAASGFGSTTSDVDLVFVREGEGAGIPPQQVLQSLKAYLESTGACYNMTRVFNVRAPLLKLTDESGIEVDMQVDNKLGLRNTALLAAYRSIGGVRAETVVRVVKEWARRCGLVGTVDGMINSYAWTILAIYYLQVVGLLPNLQALAKERGLEPVVVDGADTRFATIAAGEFVPTGSVALASAGALLCGFFEFYGNEFDWGRFAVCPRLARRAPGFVRKAEMNYGDRPLMYIEDPFDRAANLGHGTTAIGRERIMHALKAAARRTQDDQEPATWFMLCPDGFDRPCSQPFLKARLRKPCRESEVPGEMWRLFEPFGATCVFVRPDDAQAVEVYIQFGSWQELRSAQSANESNLSCCDQPIALYISLGYGLHEELDRFVAYETPSGAGINAGMGYIATLSGLFAPLPFATRTAGFAPGAANALEFVPGAASAGLAWGAGSGWGSYAGPPMPAQAWGFGMPAPGAAADAWNYGPPPGAYAFGST